MSIDLLPGFYEAAGADFASVNARSQPRVADETWRGRVTKGQVVYYTGVSTQAGGWTWLKVEWFGQLVWIAQVSQLVLRGNVRERYVDLLEYFAVPRGYSQVHFQRNNWSNFVERIQVQVAPGDWFYHVKGSLTEALAESFRASRTAVWRVWDSSPFEQPPQYYVLNDGQGAPWMHRWMRPGQSNVFVADIKNRRLDNNAVVQHRPDFTQTLTLLSQHDAVDLRSLGFAQSVHLEDVIVISGSGGANEIQVYQRHKGLVGFLNKIDKVDGVPKQSWMSMVAPDQTALKMKRIDWVEQPAPSASARIAQLDLDEMPDEEPDMPTIDIEALENNADFVKRWDNPRFFHADGLNETRIPVDDPGGVIIAYPKDWGFHVKGRDHATVAQTLNAGVSELKMDIAQKLIHQGPEKLADLGQLKLTWPGVYLFVWEVTPAIAQNPRNFEYSLRFHMEDGTAYSFTDRYGEEVLFPAFNGADHGGVWGLLVDIPQPERVKSVGLIASTNTESVVGEFYWRYVNAMYAPQGITPADLGIDAPVIEIPAVGEPTPEPEPPDEEPTPIPTPEPEPQPGDVTLVALGEAFAGFVALLKAYWRQ